jgi:CheY-like chemotaxis protein
MICLKKWKGENESPDSFLSGYEVKNVKNGEEALSLVATHFDMIIYDANLPTFLLPLAVHRQA